MSHDLDEDNNEDFDVNMDSDLHIDCPQSGPGPRGPGSGPDRKGRSECPGQRSLARTSGHLLFVPDLGVSPGPDLDRTYFLCESNVFFLMPLGFSIIVHKK